jgi:hypothetical protein
LGPARSTELLAGGAHGIRRSGRGTARHQHLPAMRSTAGDEESVALVWNLRPRKLVSQVRAGSTRSCSKVRCNAPHTRRRPGHPTEDATDLRRSSPVRWAPAAQRWPSSEFRAASLAAQSADHQKPKTTGRAGAFTSCLFGMRPTWTMSSEHGFRNHTTWSEPKAICDPSDPPHLRRPDNLAAEHTGIHPSRVSTRWVADPTRAAAGSP